MIKRFAIGVAVGATAMYFLDPGKGTARRRRAKAWWGAHGPQVRSVSEHTLRVATAQTGRVAGEVRERVQSRSAS
jgi:hypothetical protein